MDISHRQLMKILMPNSRFFSSSAQIFILDRSLTLTNWLDPYFSAFKLPQGGSDQWYLYLFIQSSPSSKNCSPLSSTDYAHTKMEIEGRSSHGMAWELCLTGREKMLARLYTPPRWATVTCPCNAFPFLSCITVINTYHFIVVRDKLIEQLFENLPRTAHHISPISQQAGSYQTRDIIVLAGGQDGHVPLSTVRQLVRITVIHDFTDILPETAFAFFLFLMCISTEGDVIVRVLE